jgi:adenosylcobalamin-dependent ribonucleoside-triphosphate reductase
VEIDLSKFSLKNPTILNVVRLVTRANYRQTCVSFRDGVLQPTWHESNDYLRLMGVGITGIAAANPSAEYLQAIRAAAHDAAREMADELGLPYSKAVTTIKPSGTLSKVMSTTEGVHKPLGKYLINNVKFSINDPLVDRLKAAGYRNFADPYSPADAIIFSFPVKWDTVDFDVVDGKHVNLESAVKQLERYKLMMDNYVDHNCSVTISYDPTEVKDIVEWLLENWDTYVGVSWIFRNDPTKTAKDLGYPYLPQEVITEEEYEEYVAVLGEVDLDSTDLMDELDDPDCATGACPVR